MFQIVLLAVLEIARRYNRGILRRSSGGLGEDINFNERALFCVYILRLLYNIYLMSF